MIMLMIFSVFFCLGAATFYHKPGAVTNKSVSMCLDEQAVRVVLSKPVGGVIP
jgi:hypothetical protein